LLVLVLPGIVFISTRVRLLGPTRDDSDSTTRALSAITLSAIFDTIYLVLFGDHVTKTLNLCPTSPTRLCSPYSVRLTAIYAFVFLFLVPFLFATVRYGHLSLTLSWNPARWIRTAGAYSRASSAWDHAARELKDSYVRVRLKDGGLIGGHLGPRSYVSTYPESHAIFIDQQWNFDTAGYFQGRIPHSRGVYLPLGENDTVEWFAAPWRGRDDTSTPTRANSPE
jgi:hypothetical protein